MYAITIGNNEKFVQDDFWTTRLMGEIETSRLFSKKKTAEKYMEENFSHVFYKVIPVTLYS